MTLIEEVLHFTPEYVNYPKSRTPDRQAKIKAAYFSLTGETLKGCSSCMVEALFKIKRIMEKKKEPCKYLLKPGAILQPFGEGIVTNDNLTDKIASNYLKAHPGATVLFSRIPEEEVKPSAPSTAPKRSHKKKT